MSGNEKFEFYDKTPDFRIASDVTMVGCDFPECGCGLVHIRFHDESGAIFARASFRAERGDEVLARLKQEIARVPVIGECAGHA